MDSATLVDGVGLVVFPMIGAVVWFFQLKKQELTDRLKAAEGESEALQNDITALRLHISEDYVKKNDFRETLQEVRQSYATLSAKIDRLVEIKEDKK